MPPRLRAASPAPRRRPRLERLEDRAVPAVAFAVGAGAGGGPQVGVFAADGSRLATYFAYAADFQGGVRVGVAELTGDAVGEVLTSPGPTDPALTAWPVDRPRNWVRVVNQPIEPRTADRLRTSIARGRPFGDETWVRRTVVRYGLQATVHDPWRPRKRTPAPE